MGYRFDLKERSYIFSVKLLKTLRPLFKDRLLKVILDQPVRSGTSVSANIQEAKFSGTRKEYARYFEIVLKSGNETMHWLKLIEETAEGEVIGIKELRIDFEEILRVLASSLISLRKNNSKSID
jgi:four helix bundle protein